MKHKCFLLQSKCTFYYMGSRFLNSCLSKRFTNVAYLVYIRSIHHYHHHSMKYNLDDIICMY